MDSGYKNFRRRHVGPSAEQKQKMLQFLGCASEEALLDKVIPKSIRSDAPFSFPEVAEQDQLTYARNLAQKNVTIRSFLGMGYFSTFTPPVIQRNILENPGWYTQYTPYQPEISQGRLEALLNFQTMICELTGFSVANASLLDEGTAAAEAMMLSFAKNTDKSRTAFFIDKNSYPQTIAVIKGRAECLGIEVVVGSHTDFSAENLFFGALLQYPHVEGAVVDYRSFIADCHKHNVLVTMACDLLSLSMLVSPGELGADIAVGNSQRFGVPMGCGGPHAAFFATKNELARLVPGRIVGVTKDAHGHVSYRLALQTREQHIRREKALSNICTAQALLAIMAGAYAIYHGPDGLKSIAHRVHEIAKSFAKEAQDFGYDVVHAQFFDTVCVRTTDACQIVERCRQQGMNIRLVDDKTVCVAFDEMSEKNDVKALLACFGKNKEGAKFAKAFSLPTPFLRQDHYMTQEVFHRFHSETEMMRYLKRLENKDVSLVHSMIPLGSCTMKLNAASELMPVSWPEFANVHPFSPRDQRLGFATMFEELEKNLMAITGFDGVSLQPNSGAQGEFAGLKIIRAYHIARGDHHRHVCLIPTSAHGTNPASAAMAGFKIVNVRCDSQGNIDLVDLEAQALQHAKDLAAFMITYPSTHGVFEERVKDICAIVHKYGGQVYLDGANMNAQVGFCRPGDYGADVCHLNLHKTFSIPHGGGGPGSGPVLVKEHLKAFLPGDHSKAISAVSSAPYGNANVLCVSWAYIRMMGSQGLKDATATAILNANYIAKRLSAHYDILYRGNHDMVAHECIVDVRPFKDSVGISVFDIAKRLMDYGFHAPTVSFPVAGTLMIEPTESESLEEIDRFCDAMIAIYHEIKQVENGTLDRCDNPLKNAPHTIDVVTKEEWTHSYSRAVAAFPLAFVKERKVWPSVGRIDEAWGDRNFCCALPSSP
jgi:glycine dehydrogenase